MHQARTAVTWSQVAQDTAHTGNTPSGQRVNRSHLAQDTAHTGNTPSGHNGEQEPNGPGNPPCNTTKYAGPPVNRSQVAQDSAHAKQRIEQAHR